MGYYRNDPEWKRINAALQRSAGDEKADVTYLWLAGDMVALIKDVDFGDKYDGLRLRKDTNVEVVRDEGENLIVKVPIEDRSGPSGDYVMSDDPPHDILEVPIAKENVWKRKQG